MRRHSHRRAVALLVVAALTPGATGCTKALADEIVRQPRWLERVSDADIRRTLEQRPDVKLPARLVVMGDPGPYGGRVVWGHEERRRIEQALAPLVGEEGGLLREVMIVETPLPRMPETEGAAFEYLKAHRLAAAQRQAEVAVVLIPMSADSTSTSPLGVLYLTIVGAFLVPATHHSSWARFDAVAVDVRDGTLIVTTSGEAESERWRPTWALDRNVGRAEARSRALDATLERFVPELERALLEPRAAGGAS